MAAEFADLVNQAKVVFNSLPKAKTAKILKSLMDLFTEIPEQHDIKIRVCKELIQWCVDEKRAYLKQTMEARLVSFARMYTDAISLINELLRELKRMDDKLMLVEVHLLESKSFFALKNIPKARTSANAVYCPPVMQAQLDLQSGILYAEEKDFKTALSYFYEALEGYSNLEDKRALLALKYMLLYVHSIVHGKLAVKYAGIEIATAYQHRSLKEFDEATKKYHVQIREDLIIQHHLNELYETLLEQNLTRIIEPYSRVEVAHIAKMIGLPIQTVERKLFYGILDQGNGCLEVFDEPQVDKTFEMSIDTIKHMGNVVESLFQKAAKLG
ncbi:PCI-domain-containing protein [Rozella allomycis CSF55]|uniref:PCI-domain-containing protein n=1 Tax=Rozella allomycis (strain CSF55) TaxID=988480 RepID=A0A4V1IZY1_ROZAC|nr:PCI-domain-containing protein [Rozella allomycis CSF55]